jgi:hypothetical protein
VPHPLHGLISDLASEAIPAGRVLDERTVRRGDQCIPLFRLDKRSLAAEFCNVDLLVLHSSKIRLIVEIEESNVKPTQIAGKFLTSALASRFIHSNDALRERWKRFQEKS